MSSRFVFLGPAHLLIIAAVPTIALALSRLSRGRPRRLQTIRYLLASSLASIAVAWYAYIAAHTGIRFPDTLPLDLCDLTLWVAVAAALTVNPTAVEFAYFVGVGGSSMALLTPDLWAPLWSWPTIAFFVQHGLVVTTPLVLIGSGATRPRAGSVVRVLLLLNAYAGAVALFNVWFGTNYMYLCRKPGNPSLLDYFGPWPFYIVSAELFAGLLFGALWLPFRRVQGPA